MKKKDFSQMLRRSSVSGAGPLHGSYRMSEKDRRQ